MKFIKVCEVSLGQNFTGIYRWVNVDQICSLEIGKQSEFDHFYLLPFITMSNGDRFLIVYRSDLVDLVGEELVSDLESSD